MRIVFVGDDLRSSGVAVIKAAGTVLRCELAGSVSDEAARTQIERVLSLDHDGEWWARVAESDSTLAALHSRRPGARPVLFHSPYEAAAWSVISLRRGRTQGQNLRSRIAEALGERIELGGETGVAFPTPERLLEADPEIQGLDPERAARLQGVARAALDGVLDPELLRSLEPAEAVERLTRIRGLGPYYAGLVVVRASGNSDALPIAEKKLIDATGRLYGRDGLDERGLGEIAEAWRPFRTWAAVLIRSSSDLGYF